MRRGGIVPLPEERRWPEGLTIVILAILALLVAWLVIALL
jgi:hypothetical protein